MKKWLFRICKYVFIFLLVLVLLGSVVVFGMGDGGYTQQIVQGIEKRAFEQKSTWFDGFFLRFLYRGMMYTGYFKYPNASKFLYHYSTSKGDTLFYDAHFFLKNPDVQEALRLRKPKIIFRPIRSDYSDVYSARYTNWDYYYAFDLLSIKQVGKEVYFYDRYRFVPLKKKSYTPFKVGKVRFLLNDGLIHTAYPEAKEYITCGKAVLP